MGVPVELGAPVLLIDAAPGRWLQSFL